MFRLIKRVLIYLKIMRAEVIQKDLQDIQNEIGELAVAASAIGKKVSELKRGRNFTGEEINQDKLKLQEDILDVIHTLEKISLKVSSID